MLGAPVVSKQQKSSRPSASDAPCQRATTSYLPPVCEDLNTIGAEVPPRSRSKCPFSDSQQKQLPRWAARACLEALRREAQPQGTGILGAGAQAKPFGSLGGGSLFGASTATQPQPAAAATSAFGGSLLGQPAKPSLFGTSAAAQPAAGPQAAAPTNTVMASQGGSLFASTNLAAGLNQSQAQPSSRPTGAYFDSLPSEKQEECGG